MVDILVFGAHPDDIEFGCGGILAKASAQGHSILCVDLTVGDKSTNGSVEVRRREGEGASNVIGAQRLFLDFLDCEVYDTYEGRLKLVRVIREYRPRLILAPLCTDGQHPDHIACGRMARYACRYARFAKILPQIPSHKVEGILYYLPQYGARPDFIIDISGHVDTWVQMMESHKSQLQTYPYAEWALRGAAYLGSLLGVPYAQGLAKENPIVIDDILSVSQSVREI